MRRRDASLVFFTTLSQWSIGIVLWLTALRQFQPETAAFTESVWSPGNPVLLALALIGLATGVSFMHLGNPSNAPKALRNLGSSWLSREILAIGLYSFSLLAVFLHGWLGAAAGLGGLLLLVCSVTGLFLLWAMVRIYTVPTIPSWNSWYTPQSFATAALGLGLVTLFVMNGASLAQMGVLLALLVLEGISGLLNHARLAKMDTGIAGPVFKQGLYFKLFVTRMVVLLAAICLALLFIVSPAGTSASPGWYYSIALLVATQAIAGRILFYSSYFRTGI